MPETQAARPGMMPPSGPIQSQHAHLWAELCELRRKLLVIDSVLRSGFSDADAVAAIREAMG